MTSIMEAEIDEWRALEILLAANFNRPHRDSLSDEDLVRLALDYLHAPTVESHLRILVRDPARELRPALIPSNAQVAFAELRLSLTDEALALQTKNVREQARADLQALIDGPLTAKTLIRLTDSASQQALLPVFDFDNDGLRIRYRYRVNSIAAALDYAVLLIFDRKRPFLKDVCRCKLDGCGRFFLLDRATGGRPRKDYCCKGHMDQAHDAAGAKRADLSRRKRANAAAAAKAAKHK